MDETTTLRDWLLTVRADHGYLTPEVVRDAARPKDSPAHHWIFNVPPDRAAEAHYLDRAHDLIRRVRVSVRAADDAPPRRVRFFHAVPSDDAMYVYEPLDAILAAPDKLASVRRQAERRLREAADAVDELASLVAAPASRRRAVRAAGSVRRAREAVATI